MPRVDGFVAAARRMRRTRGFVALGLCGLVLGPLAPTASERPAAVDLTVTGVEVTQAIQTPTNSIKLVALRSTAVRATLGVTGSAGPVAGVTGRLHVFVGGTEITPAAGVAPINAPFMTHMPPYVWLA